MNNEHVIEPRAKIQTLNTKRRNLLCEPHGGCLLEMQTNFESQINEFSKHFLILNLKWLKLIHNYIFIGTIMLLVHLLAQMHKLESWKALQ